MYDARTAILLSKFLVCVAIFGGIPNFDNTVLILFWFCLLTKPLLPISIVKSCALNPLNSMSVSKEEYRSSFRDAALAIVASKQTVNSTRIMVFSDLFIKTKSGFWFVTTMSGGIVDIPTILVSGKSENISHVFPSCCDRTLWI